MMTLIMSFKMMMMIMGLRLEIVMINLISLMMMIKTPKKMRKMMMFKI